MSRSCMYCGRDLQKGEICTCPQSVKMREARQKQDTKSKASESGYTNTYSEPYSHTNYNTSTNYTAPPPRQPQQEPKRKKKINWDKFKVKQKFDRFEGKNFFIRLFALLGDFLKSPIYTASKPGMIGKGTLFSLLALQGIFISMASFMSAHSMRGLFGLASSAFGFRGMAGWQTLGHMMLSILSGTAVAFIQFFILTGIFYFADRFIVKRGLRFWDLGAKFAVCGIPMIFIGILGVVFSIVSSSTFIILVCCGLILEVMLIYEMFSTEWSVSRDKLLYIMAGGFFLYISICYNIIKFLV